MGRPPIGDRAMTSAERQRRFKARIGARPAPRATVETMDWLCRLLGPDHARKARDAFDQALRRRGWEAAATASGSGELQWTEASPSDVTAERKDGSVFAITATVHEGEISHHTVIHIAANGDIKVLGRAKSLDAAKAMAQNHVDGPRGD